jgi:hypothetical protein
MDTKPHNGAGVDYSAPQAAKGGIRLDEARPGGSDPVVLARQRMK